MRLIERINNNIGNIIFKSNFQSTYHKCVEESHLMNALHLRNYFYKNKCINYIKLEFNLPSKTHL